MYLETFLTHNLSIMATSFAPFFISGGSHVKSGELFLTRRNSCGIGSKLTVQRRSNLLIKKNNRSSSICAEYRDNRGGGIEDFLAGFLLGSAVIGTVAYIFSPQIRQSLLKEDDCGFRKSKRAIYYDGEGTMLTLNDKIKQLNSAIDNVSSRLRGGNKKVPVANVESDPEMEATV